MATNRNARYPYHLAKLVTARLRERNLDAPPNRVLLRLFETLYFASLKTDESRPCLCTVNYVDPDAESGQTEGERRASDWTTIRFGQSLPLDVRTLTKLAEAADPTVSSLAVFSDENCELFIWGIVDQELRYGDYVAMDWTADPKRPGLFQVTITGVGNICVYKDYALLGSLEQNTLVDQYHDVLWAGPVYKMLKGNLHGTLADEPASRRNKAQFGDVSQVENELLIRWQNAICRVLLNIQQYRHGGGLLIVPRCPADYVNVKYEMTYDRLPNALLGLVRHQFLKRQVTQSISEYSRDAPSDVLPRNLHFDALEYQRKFDEHKNEALGCVRFIASLSRVDGFVLLDKSLVVHGFGVELRQDSDLTDVYLAGDPAATPRLRRQAYLSQFGTRHRAMMRYCYEHAGTLGFVISQDGDIRATMRVADRLVLWENINVQLAFKTENRGTPISNFAPMMGLFQGWVHTLASLGSSQSS